MFFNKRKRYNGDVATLLPAFGFDLEEAGAMKTLNVLDIAWQQGYSQHEAALFVGYCVFAGMLDAKHQKTNDVLERIRFVQRDWVAKGIVRSNLVEAFSAKADERISRASGRSGG